MLTMSSTSCVSRALNLRRCIGSAAFLLLGEAMCDSDGVVDAF
jgi:hypothetical protein